MAFHNVFTEFHSPNINTQVWKFSLHIFKEISTWSNSVFHYCDELIVPFETGESIIYKF